MWLLAEIALWSSGRAAKRAEASIADAKRLNARADWWSDVQAWADNLGTWRELRGKRLKLQTGKG